MNIHRLFGLSTHRASFPLAMVTLSSHRSRVLRLQPFVLVVMFVVVCAGMSASSNWTSSCPNGTRATAAACVLDADLVLTDTIELSSFTILDCRGHRILPTAVGSGLTQASYVPSVPAVAIAITGDREVRVRNCKIGAVSVRFDFGIIAMNSKDAGKDGHRIHNNEIHARDSAVTFLRVDDARVNDNFITWTNGAGISFVRDSDRNRVNNNVMSSPGSPPAATLIVPGGSFSNTADVAILLANLHLQPLFNLVINGNLSQFPNSENGQYSSNEDNVIEGNHLSLPGASEGKTHGGILVATNATRSRVNGNTIVEAGTGIRLAGLAPAQLVQRPAHCMDPNGQETARFCATDGDCHIAGIDLAPVGTCPSPLIMDVRDLRARDTVVEGNTLYGPFNSTVVAMRAAIFGGNGTVGGIIRGNQIYGTGIETGITLAGDTIQTGMVTGNEIHGASFGLQLQQGIATNFGARIFLNNITGSTTRAIGVLGAYALPTELSWDGKGNYWGHLLPPCFRSSDTPLGVLIQDSYPFCVPVAAPQ